VRKGINPNLAKIHRNCTVEEVAGLFGVHKNTVRAWVKNGLNICDDKKPMLILGSVLREFIRNKKTAHKQKCKPWEFYCMRCRRPQSAAGSMADYEPQTSTRGCLMALCSGCETSMNKYFSLAKLEGLNDKLDITIPIALKHINKSDEPLLNSDFNE